MNRGKLEHIYRDAQIAASMDGGLYIGGTEHYSADRFIESLAEEIGISLPPRLTYEDIVFILKNTDREGEIEYVMEVY